jgi:hypothetical protein
LVESSRKWHRSSLLRWRRTRPGGVAYSCRHNTNACPCTRGCSNRGRSHRRGQDAAQPGPKWGATACNQGTNQGLHARQRSVGSGHLSGSPPPDSHDKWIGQQDPTDIPNGGQLLDSPPGYPDGLLVIEDEDDQRRQRIIVPSEKREWLIKQEHLFLLHVGPERVARALTKQALLLAQDERPRQEDRHVVS